MGFEREVAGVQELHPRVRVVARKGLGARRQEEGIVSPPHREQGRPMRAEVLVELVDRNLCGARRRDEGGCCRVNDSVAAYHAARRWRARCMRVLLRRGVARLVLAAASVRCLSHAA